MRNLSRKGFRAAANVGLSAALAFSLSTAIVSDAWAVETDQNVQMDPTGVRIEGNFKYAITTQGTAAIVGLVNEDVQSIDIPAEIDGIAVGVIDENAFRNNGHVTSVVIPNGVKTIGEYAFYGCSNLHDVSIADSVTEIKDYAFYRSGIQSIELPDNLTSLGYAVFSFCESLASIAVPNGITTLEGYMFSGCKSLAQVSLPSSLEEIKFNAFSECLSLTTIQLPENLRSLESEAFSGCSSLSRVALPASVESIGNDVFKGLKWGSLVTVQTRALYRQLNEDLEFWCSPNRTSLVYEEGYPAVITSLTISPESVSMREWGSEELSAVISPTEASDAKIEWNSSDASVATVDEFGLVSAVDLGEATIVAKAEGTSDSCLVSVTSDAPVQIGRYDRPREFWASAEGPGSITWSVSNPSIIEISGQKDNTYNDRVDSYTTVKPVGIGSTMLSATIDDKLVYYAEIDVYDENQPNIEDAMVYGLEGDFVLDEGQETVTPSVDLEYDGWMLVEGEDYTVSFADNDKVGTATATITGIGRFTGAITVPFRVVAGLIDISKAEVSGLKESYVLGGEGNVVEPKPVIKLNGKELVEGSDYVLSYSANDKVGTATIWIRGIGGYAGTLMARFAIVGSDDPTPEPNPTPVPDPEPTPDPEPAPSIEFDDAPESAWYVKEGFLDYVVSNGIMTGVKNAEGEIVGFFPEDGITRGQVATILYRAANPGSVSTTDPDYYSTTSLFGDVPAGAYYTAAINWCKTNGIIQGYASGPNAGGFGPDDLVSREQLAAMVYRFAVYAGADGALSESEFDSMPDRTSVSDFATKAMAWCYENGVITGQEEADGTYLRPAGNATRAQATKIFTVVLRDVLEK